MRVWLNGRASSFQVDHAGSIPAARSMITRNLRCGRVPLAAWEPGDPYHALRPRWAASAARAAYRPELRDGSGHCGCGSTAELRLPKSPARVRPPPSARIGHAPVAQWSGRLAYTEDIMGSNPIGSTIAHGDVAQQVGHLASNEKAAGSTPAISTTPTTSRRSKPVRWRSASCMRARGNHTVRARPRSATEPDHMPA